MAQSGSRAVFSSVLDRGFTVLRGSEVTSIIISIRIMVIEARYQRGVSVPIRPAVLTTLKTSVATRCAMATATLAEGDDAERSRRTGA
jgi:hypothetical protein